MPISSHNDEPTLDDQLGRLDLVRSVGKAVATCRPPQVFGVHGDWGLGKTSFLHQLHLHLVGECPQQENGAVEKAVVSIQPIEDYKNRVKVVWFEAWRYQNEDAPVVALLHEIRSQLAWYVKALNTLSKASQIAIRGALLSLEDLTKKIGFQASKIEQAGEKWEKENLASALPSNTVREQLEQAIGQLLENLLKVQSEDTETAAQRRIVVIIDDLDRCNPEGAYRLLEGLKIYLTLRNCVFVLGMNQQIVEDAIAKQIAGPEHDDKLRAERASAYLEKLCQNVWRLPAVFEPKDYLLKLLEYSKSPGSTEVWVRWVKQAISDHRCLPPNPRRLKGLSNLLIRFSERLPKNHGPENDSEGIREARYMLIVAYIYQFHPDLYRLWESNPKVHDHLLSWARGYNLELTGAQTEEEKSQEKTMLLYQVLTRLRRAAIIRKLEQTPVKYSTDTAFPDPADSQVFWAQILLHEATRDMEESGPIDRNVYNRYLYSFNVSLGIALE